MLPLPHCMLTSGLFAPTLGPSLQLFSLEQSSLISIACTLLPSSLCSSLTPYPAALPPPQSSPQTQIPTILLLFPFFPCICYLPDAILFSQSIYHVYCLLFLSPSLTPLVLCLFCSLMYSKHILQCLEHSKCSIYLLNGIK